MGGRHRPKLLVAGSERLCRSIRTRRLTCPSNVLRGRDFRCPYCFPQFANSTSVVDPGSSLTIKARTVTIFSGHTVPFRANTATQTLACMEILLGSIRRARGRQSRNESQTIDNYTIALTPYNSNTICDASAYTKKCATTFSVDRAQLRRIWGKNSTLETFRFLRRMTA
jgi:hypothetical protein